MDYKNMKSSIIENSINIYWNEYFKSLENYDMSLFFKNEKKTCYLEIT